MKPFKSVMELLDWLCDNGVRHQITVVTDWNPEGPTVRRVKPIRSNNRNRVWLHQRHNDLFFHV